MSGKSAKKRLGRSILERSDIELSSRQTRHFPSLSILAGRTPAQTLGWGIQISRSWLGWVTGNLVFDGAEHGAFFIVSHHALDAVKVRGAKGASPPCVTLILRPMGMTVAYRRTPCQWCCAACRSPLPNPVDKYAVFSGLGSRNRGKIAKTNRLLAEMRKQRGNAVFGPASAGWRRFAPPRRSSAGDGGDEKGPASAGAFSSGQGRPSAF